MATDPFGKETFGGTSVPGGASLVTTPASTSTADSYKWKGQGWNDPLAQQMYQKYIGGSQLDRLVGGANRQRDVGMENMTYNTPVDPTTWGGTYRGDAYDQMKNAYIAAGGLGTAEQLAGTYKTPAETEAAAALTKAGGSGSSNVLSSDVLSKMWR